MEKLKTLKSNYSLFLKNILSIGYKLKNNYEVKNFRQLGDKYFISLTAGIKDIFTNANKRISEDYFIDLNTSIPVTNACYEENANIKAVSKYEKDNNLEARVIKTEKETFLEIWYKDSLLNSIKVDDFKIKQIYTDCVFGKPRFSENGKKLIFIAEFDSTKEYKNYFSINDKDLEEEDKIEKNLDKFKERQSFGEALEDKAEPFICIYNLEDKKLYKLDLANYPTIYPALPQFDNTNNDIIFSGYEFPNYKLGIIYCLKRKSGIFLVHNPLLDEIKKEDKKTFSTNQLIRLSGDNDYEFTNIYPNFSPGYKTLVYYSNEKAVPHMNGLTLRVINWEEKTALDKLEKVDYSTIKSKEVLSKLNNPQVQFNGIYTNEEDLVYSKFINEDIFVFGSICQAASRIYLYDFKNNLLSHLPEENSMTRIIEVRPNESCIVTINSDVNILPYVKLVKFFYKKYSNHIGDSEIVLFEDNVKYINKLYEGVVTSTIVTDTNKEFLSIAIPFQEDINEYKLYLNNILENTVTKTLHYDGVHGHLIYSKLSEYEKRPVIYFIHGGPNGIISQQFLWTQLLFLAHGYAILVVHYPGSIGYGQNYINALVGNIGKLDIESQGEFLLSALKEYNDILDSNNITAYGGSHGGFSACWLSVHEKYSKLITSACIRNPVTDLPMMMGSSDIPDWVIGQTVDKENCFVPSSEDYNMFYDRSPVYLSKNCKTPTLMMLGKADRRVPYFNGYYYYFAIKENGCDAKLLVYPKDSHPLSTLETEVDVFFNICYWIEKHRK
jgi:acylaminoacyl-peptidase